MRAHELMKKLGVPSGTSAGQKVVKLMRFHFAMGATDDQVIELVKPQVEELRQIEAEKNNLLKKQVMQYMWQRYRNEWPVVRNMHRAESKSGRTSYYYSTIGKFTPPPHWCFVIEGNNFVITQTHLLRNVIITHDDILAEFDSPQSASTHTVIESVIEVAPDESAEIIPPEPPKREGKETRVKTRPDQLTFAQAVEHNCFDTCVVTGVRIHSRCSAAHLVEHKDGGADYYNNGLWMRWDIHKMFDDGWCAIDPETMQFWFLKEAIALDADLAVYQGKRIGELRRPINPDFLAARWEAFQALNHD